MSEGPALRVSDAERDAAVDMLQQAYSDGRIDKDELDTRLEAALAARTRADLAGCVRGLPLGSTGSGAPTTSSRSSASSPVRPGSPPGGGERLAAMGTHWLGLCTLFVGPAIVAAVAERRSFVRDQALEAMNFQLTFLGACLAIGIGAGLTFGVAAIAFPIVLLVWFVVTGVGGLSALVGNRFRYPWTVRLVR